MAAVLDTALVESLKGLAGSADDGSRTGVLIGTKSCAGALVVMLAAPTPTQEDDGAEAEWAAAHASQVQRMLLGGLRVVGTFCAGMQRNMSAITRAVATVDGQLSDPADNSFFELSCDDAGTVLLKRCTSAGTDPKTTSYSIHACASDLRGITCSIDIDMCVALPRQKDDDACLEAVQTCVLETAQQLRQAAGTCAAMGQTVDSTSDFTRVNLFHPGLHACGQKARQLGATEAAGKMLRLHGCVNAFAYQHAPKQSDFGSAAARLLALDAAATLESRMSVLSDDWEENGSDLLRKGGRAQLPQRVLAPAGDVFRVCDHKLERESFGACKARFRDMLGLVVDVQSFVVPEQRNNSGSSHDSVGVVGGAGSSSSSSSKSSGSGLLAALFGILALLLAIMFAMK